MAALAAVALERHGPMEPMVGSFDHPHVRSAS